MIFLNGGYADRNPMFEDDVVPFNDEVYFPLYSQAESPNLRLRSVARINHMVNKRQTDIEAYSSSIELTKPDDLRIYFTELDIWMNPILTCHPPYIGPFETEEQIALLRKFEPNMDSQLYDFWGRYLLTNHERFNLIELEEVLVRVNQSMGFRVDLHQEPFLLAKLYHLYYRHFHFYQGPIFLPPDHNSYNRNNPSHLSYLKKEKVKRIEIANSLAWDLLIDYIFETV